MAIKKISGARNLIGSWSFLVGVILAVILGLGLGGVYMETLLWVVFLLGIVVGLLNIASTEVGAFLTSGAILVLVSYLALGVKAPGSEQLLLDTIPIVSGILRGILVLFVPATIIVALKSVFVLAKK